jgi:hypothetical protein
MGFWAFAKKFGFYKPTLFAITSNYIDMASANPGFLPMMKQRSIEDKCKQMRKHRQKLIQHGETVTPEKLLTVVTKDQKWLKLADTKLQIHMDEWKFYARQIAEGKK